MAIAPRMEPEWSDKASASPKYLRVLLLGAPKIGKTACAVGTSPGPTYVINCDQKQSVDSAKIVHPKVRFASNLVHSRSAMEDALKLAYHMVSEQGVKTIVWDTISGFGSHLEEECAKKTENGAGEPDGRRYWPVYTKYLVSTCRRLFKLNAHVIACSHWVNTGNSDEMAGGVAKTGPGIVPLLGRSARALVAAEFDDVIFMEKTKGQRVFMTDIEGVWGPGCRNLVEKVIDADFAEVIRQGGFSGVKGKAVASKPVAGGRPQNGRPAPASPARVISQRPAR